MPRISNLGRPIIVKILPNASLAFRGHLTTKVLPTDPLWSVFHANFWWSLGVNSLFPKIFHFIKYHSWNVTSNKPGDKGKLSSECLLLTMSGRPRTVSIADGGKQGQNTQFGGMKTVSKYHPPAYSDNWTVPQVWLSPGHLNLSVLLSLSAYSHKQYTNLSLWSVLLLTWVIKELACIHCSW